MISMHTKIKQIRDLMLEVTENTYHYKALKQPDQYIVYAEDTGGNDLAGDNKKTCQAIQGTIDYFTKTEFDPNVEKIQEQLNNAEISFYLNSIQFEEETEYIHWEWVWEVG